MQTNQHCATSVRCSQKASWCLGGILEAGGGGPWQSFIEFKQYAVMFFNAQLQHKNSNSLLAPGLLYIFVLTFFFFFAIHLWSRVTACQLVLVLRTGSKWLVKIHHSIWSQVVTLLAHCIFSGFISEKELKALLPFQIKVNCILQQGRLRGSKGIPGDHHSVSVGLIMYLCVWNSPECN